MLKPERMNMPAQQNMHLTVAATLFHNFLIPYVTIIIENETKISSEDEFTAVK